jgi:hypothetical protein
MKNQGRINQLRRQNLIYLGLSVLLVIGGYLWLRSAYAAASQWPFTQEILLVILGIVATILITALLLNKQTEVELEKEWSIKLADLKTDIYLSLINHIEHLLASGKVTPEDKLRLRFLTHKLALVAAPNVLEEFERFIDVFNTASSDDVFSSREAGKIHEALARLTAEIRADLVGETDSQSGYSAADIRQQIMENTRQSG